MLFSIPCFSTDFQLVGSWKSVEEKTLASMRATTGITKEARELFEDKFFGKLSIHYKAKEYRAYIPDETDDLKEFDKYYPYSIIDRSREYIDVRRFDPLLNSYEKKRLYIENNCYYVYTTKWQFKEYFCKVE